MHLIPTRIGNSPVLRRCVFAAAFAATCFATAPVIAQQTLYPSSNAGSIQSGVSTGAVDIPQTNLTPVGPPPTSYAPPSSFDPYGTTPSAQYGGGIAPSTSGIGTSGIGTSGIGTSGIGPIYGSPPGASTLPTSPPAGVAAIGPPTAVPTIAPGSSLGATGAIPPSPPGGSLFSRIFSSPAGYGAPSQPPVLGTPNYGVPSYGAAAPTYAAPTYGSPVYGPSPQLPGIGPNPATVYGSPDVYGASGGSQFPTTAYPSTNPSVLFPGGLFPGGVFAGGALAPMQGYDAFRLFQGPRLSHSFVSGGSKPTGLQVNNTDVSLVFAFPNFLYCAQPLFVIPSFSLQLWDGPNGITGADLPPNVYSGFLDMGWESDPNKMFSSEFGVRLGIFTDFNTNNSDSFRALGKALFNFRCTPATTFKAGVYYLDRNSVKLVPAGGILYQPTPYRRLDLFFPEPKLSHYCRTIGTQDVWWYLAGDFGGGSWTIQRADGTSDSVDINSLRAVLGVEWGMSEAIRAGRRTAFMEIGYVFNREIKYRHNPQDNIKPDDGIMVRAGIGY